MKRIAFFLALILPVFSYNLYSQTQQALVKPVMNFSMKEAQDYAFTNNYDLKNSGYDVQIANKVVKANTAIGLPQVSGGIDYTDFFVIPTTLIPGEFIGQPGTTFPVQFGTEYNATLKANISQLLYSGQYLVGLQTARAYLESVKEQNRKDKMDVRDLVATNYLTVLLYKEQLKITDSILRVMNQNVDEIRASFKQGLVEDVDVSQLELNQSDLQAILLNTSSSLELTTARLKFSMGLRDSQNIILTDSLETFISSLARDVLMAQTFDYTSNIDYSLLKKRIYVTLMQLKLAKTAYQPTVSGFVNLSANAQRSQWSFVNDTYPWYETANWGVSVTIPIWSSGNRKYTVDQAKLNYEKMKVNEEKLKTGLDLQVTSAKNDFNNAYLVYLNKKKGLDVSTRIYLKMVRRYREGVSGSTDLNQRYNQFLQSQRDYLLSMYSLLNLKIQLARLLEKI